MQVNPNDEKTFYSDGWVMVRKLKYFELRGLTGHHEHLGSASISEEPATQQEKKHGIKHSFTIIINNRLKFSRLYTPIYMKRYLQFYKALYTNYSIASFEFYNHPGR